MVSWIERECEIMRIHDELAVDLPPSLLPFIKPHDPDWRSRYKEYNQPGEYHNGGVWPFICGFYIAALVAVKRYQLAEQKLEALRELVKAADLSNIGYGFNEWLRAQDGKPMGEDWQSWSAAMYLYAAKCVEEKRTPFFDVIRSGKKA
jgi:glycogen debranching enzyme